MKIETEERGWPAHFCAVVYCFFRRNTLVTCGSKRIVVSTVGNMQAPESWPKNIPFTQEIGCDRHYETMVFWAKKAGPYWEADISREISFESPWSIRKLDGTTDGKANEMHEKVVAEIIEKIPTLKTPRSRKSDL